MIQASTYKMPQNILDKLLCLLNLHMEEKRQFERAASSVADRQQRDTIYNLAQESNQYISEITSQLITLGVETANLHISSTVGNNDLLPDSAQPSPTTSDEGQKVFQYCKEREKLLIGAYREMLNEPFLVEGVRTLMRSQLNGVMYAFLQLKLLL